MGSMRKLVCSMTAVGLAIAFGVATPASAGAASDAPHVCSGSLSSPGVLAGSFGSVSVQGLCVVNAGPATVTRNVVITPGSALVAAFGRNDHTGTGHSPLSVGGDLLVQPGGTLLLGCNPQQFACLDDSSSHPTLTETGHVGGSLVADHALGLIVHSSSIGADLDQTGGGGGFNCTPSGIFQAFNSPVYSAYETTSIGGNAKVIGLHTCWLGFANDQIAGNVRLINDQLADPDGPEILANNIQGNLVCLRNSRTWDSSEANFGQSTLFPRTPHPNTVHGSRGGQCVLASPATPGGPHGPGLF